MSNYYLDTSALAKRYVVEVGTGWTRHLIQPSAGNVALISDLSTVEIISLLARRQRENLLTAAIRLSLENAFRLHARQQYLVFPMDEPVLVQARQFVGKHVLRTLDAIQLATAVYAARLLNTPLTFITADNNLLTAASAEGLATDDPSAHP